PGERCLAIKHFVKYYAQPENVCSGRLFIRTQLFGGHVLRCAIKLSGLVRSRGGPELAAHAEIKQLRSVKSCPREDDVGRFKIRMDDADGVRRAERVGHGLSNG